MDRLLADVTTGLRSFELSVRLDVGCETLALVGPSGAGKSTVLRAIAGITSPDAGRITLGDVVWFDAAAGVRLPPERRSVGMVFQDYALFPHLSVRDNVAFGAAASVDDLLERMRIAPLADARPGTLSGGERQRVALARALARAPRVLLLDEPLAALDAHTRTAVRAELQDLLAALALPSIVVTHDFGDAAALADRAAVIVDGRLRQQGTIAELVAAPADAFVAAFTGANLLTGVVPGGTAIAVYPWEIELLRGDPRPAAAGRVVLERVVQAGSREGGGARGGPRGLRAGGAPPSAPAVGDRVWATFAAAHARPVPEPRP